MFAPSRDQVRQFFFDTWKKHRRQAMPQGLEATALEIVLLHPEYHAVLDNPERYLEQEYFPEMGETNPFLHMAMHLSLEEQLAIDQPPGVKAAFDGLATKLGSRHDASHAAIECLGEMLWRAQGDGAPPDGAAYVECINARGRG